MNAAASPGLVAAPHAESNVDEERAFGFWLYLMSDAILFALLFSTYAVMVGGTAGGPAGTTLFDLPNALAETMLLLVSSVTFGYASMAMNGQRKAALLGWLLVTFILGLAFVGLELSEFHGMIAAGAGPERSGFLSAFFALVGAHGLHVSFGLVWILVMAAQVTVKGLSVPVRSRLMRLGLFWHFLDIVWVGIFSVVYLPAFLR
jgi:cytochrome o ubiquinol oxidase subunit 3